MAQIIHSDGTIEDVEPKNGKDFQLSELQKIVGGYIEIVRLGDKIMVVNEEGKLKGLPHNAEASMVVFLATAVAEIIVGDVLVCDKKQVK